MENTGQGKLFGISMGTGKSDQITDHAWKLLERTDTVWTYPRKDLTANIRALSIAEKAGLKPPAAHTCLFFPENRDAHRQEKALHRAADLVLRMLNHGQDVLFMVEGDAIHHDAFKNLTSTLEKLDHGITVETIPENTIVPI